MKPVPELRRTLGLPLLVLYGLGVTIGAGIFALIGEIAGLAGDHAPLAFLIAGLVAAATGYSYAVLAAAFPRAGGEAVFVNMGLGASWARLVGLGVLLTAIIFSLAGFINGVFARNFDQVNWIPTFILTPLTYFGGVFYSINLLPEWARTLSFANPVLHMVNAFRFGFLDRSDVAVGWAFGIMALAAVVLFFVALRLMDRGTGLKD
jgi:amino acid transporter